VSLQLGVVAALLVAGMLALGTALDPAVLRDRLRSPGGLLVVLGVNLVAVPASGLLLAGLLPLEPAVATGLVLAAASPGGGTGALLALHARGDVPTGVVLQVVLAGASLLVTPLWVRASAGADVDVAPLVVGLLGLQVLPLLLGAALRATRPAAAAALHPLARRTADLTLALLVVGLLVAEGDQLPRIGGGALAAMALLVVVTLATGLLPVGDGPVRRAAAMTTAVRNLSLALLAATYVPDPALTSLAVLAYGLVMYVLAAAAVVLLRR
jgi:bile acid:Na+ symporter, BASS family